MKRLGLTSVLVIFTAFNIYKVHTCTTLYASSSTQYLESHTGYGTSNYNNNYDDCWIIRSPDQSKIVRLGRSTFDLEEGSSSCEYDRLKIYDSSTTSGNSINFCGSSVFSYLYSSGTSMYLKFTTDSSKQYEGFRLSYRTASSSLYSSSQWSSSTYNYNSSYSSTVYLSIGTIIGIVFGIIVLLSIVGIVICVCVASQGRTRGRVGAVGGRGIVVTQQQQQAAYRGAPPYGAQPYGAQPYGAQPYGAQPYGAQPAGMQPPPPYGQTQQPPPYKSGAPPSNGINPGQAAGVATVSGAAMAANAPPPAYGNSSQDGGVPPPAVYYPPTNTT